MSQVVVSAPSASLLIPADVLVGADDVEGFAQRIVDDFGGALAVGIFLGADEESGGDEAGWVELVGEVDHGGEVFGAGFGVGGFVSDGPEDDGGFVAVAADHLT